MTKKKTEEWKKMMSEVQKRNWASGKTGHNSPFRNKLVSEKTKEAMSKKEVYKKLCAGRKRYCQSEEHKKLFAKRTSLLWKNNPELHPNRSMKNNSKGQKSLYFSIKKLFCSIPVKSELPVKHNNGVYFLDVAIPSLMLAFEYDGGYWHKKENVQRDETLKSLGWKITHLISDVKDKKIEKITGWCS